MCGDTTKLCRQQAGAAFAELGKDPLQAAIKLHQQYGFLKASTLEQIRSLEEQGRVTEAATVAQKAFSDAHDVYHGNSDLAKEYFIKYDTQRKAAIQKVLTPEQYVKFEQTVKDVGYKGKEFYCVSSCPVPFVSHGFKSL